MVFRLRTNLRNITALLLFIVLIIGMFQIGYETAVMQRQMIIQQQQDWFTRYLQEEYGVSSIEELQMKYMQEAYENVTAMLEQEKLEYQNYMYMFPTRADYFEQKIEQLDETQRELEQSLLSQGTMPETEEQQVGLPPVYMVLNDILGCNVVMVTFPILGLSILAAITSREPQSKRGKQAAKLLCYVLIVFAVAVISYKAGYVYGQSTSVTIEPGSFTETASYIIYGEDTNNDGIMDIIYGKNGKTGKIDFRSTDAASVIQNAIDALTNGGKIYIKRGSYQITSIIELNSNVHVIGEGVSTHLFCQSGLEAIFRVKADNSDITGVRIENIYFDGIDRTGALAGILLESVNANLHEIDIIGCYFGRLDVGVKLNGTSSYKVEHVLLAFNNFGGFYGSNTRAIHLSNCNEIRIIGNIIEDETELGLYAEYCSRLSIVANHFDDCQERSIWFYEQVFQSVIAGCYFDWSPTIAHIEITKFSNRNTIMGCCLNHGTVGILLKSGFNTIIANNIHKGGEGIRLENADRCVVHGNNIEGVDDYGIYLVGGASENVVEANKITACGKGIYARYDASNNVIIFNDCWNNAVNYDIHSNAVRICKFNNGYATENSGVATGLSNGAYIAHGLADVPSVVVLTCLNATYDGVPVIVSWNQALTNSTHIAVNIYWANGTAIADSVIAVSWYAEV